MSIATTDEQQALGNAIREWATAAGTVAAVRAQETGSTWRPLWTDLASSIGLFAVGVPDELGGAGGDLVDVAVAVEQAAAALVPGPVLPTAVVGQVLAADPASPVAKEFLPLIAAGTATFGVALPGVLTSADTPDGGILISGDAGLASEADHLLLSAGGRWFVVDADAPGVTVTPSVPLDFSRPLGHVHCEAVEVAAERFVAGDRVVDLAVTLGVAEAVGVADRCLRTAVEYAKVREQFGRPIGAFQAIAHLCAEMLCRVEQAVALAWDAARSDADPIAVAAAGAIAFDAAVDTAKDCIQVLGGIGFTWEHDAHLYLRRALALRQLFGGTGTWRRRTARLALSGARRTVDVAVEAADIPDLPRDRIGLADSGYLAPHWPAPYGRDAGPAEQLAIDKALADAGIHRPDLVIGGWAAPTILAHGTPEQCERFVGPTLRGEITWCQLFSEPGAGSDLASLRTRATRVEGGWRLSGQKVWTSLATVADWAICLARTDPDSPKHKGISYFLVDMKSPGIDIRPLREITGDAVFNEVFLDDVFVPEDCLVGEENGGWRLARTTLANERVAMSGGSSLGEGVERLLAVAAGQGRADDVEEHERIGALCAQGMATALLDLRTTLRALDGREPGPESSVRKLVGVEHRQAVAEAALDLLGPAGATQDGALADLVHEFLLTRCLSIAGGTTQVLRGVVAERVLGLPRQQLT
ncbi:MAG TPA: acyl-CoA dehydrogenase family protein [Pseudonocardiaceae bacterium]|nr:acyl-CoA dehydrogenase family protein [Pseudonocardiaceae bacterium]